MIGKFITFQPIIIYFYTSIFKQKGSMVKFVKSDLRVHWTLKLQYYNRSLKYFKKLTCVHTKARHTFAIYRLWGKPLLCKQDKSSAFI